MLQPVEYVYYFAALAVAISFLSVPTNAGCGRAMVGSPVDSDSAGDGGSIRDAGSVYDAEAGSAADAEAGVAADGTFEEDAGPRCGDGVAQGSESCDGSDLRGTECADLGLSPGELRCRADCSGYDVFGCGAVCGNGVKEGYEECDATDLGGVTCEGLGFVAGGELACEGASCSLDTSGCCGDGVRGAAEACDGADLGGIGCTDLGPAWGFMGGQLGCDGSCELDVAGCHRCGDGICQADEDAGGCQADCGIVNVATGSYNTCAVRADGAVLCWGAAWDKNIVTVAVSGDATVPQVVAGAGSAQAVALGLEFACVLLRDGTVWCWGNNDDGQLGDGTFTSSQTPVRVLGFATSNRVRAIDARFKHACALLTSGNIYCWGNNAYGQLGDGTLDTRSQPTAVTGVSGAASLALAYSHGCATFMDGAARCWGNNRFGQLGDGTRNDSVVPVSVMGVHDASDIATGDYTTCIRSVAGDVRCWGNDSLGGLGDGPPMSGETTIAPSAPILTGASSIAVGKDHACATIQGGPTHCWGHDESGQLGIGRSTWGDSPRAVAGPWSGVKVSAGRYYTCVLEHNGTLRCFGNNERGQLGHGGAIRQAMPTTVSGLSPAVDVSASMTHTCAALADGTAWCWGNNRYGKLGDGSEQWSPVPVQVVGLTGIRRVAVGGRHSCAVDLTGGAYCWGDNGYGRLGDGTNVESPIPVTVIGLAAAEQISAGGSHTCALLSDHTVWCWGDNRRGQIGDGTMQSRTTPQLVQGLPPVGRVLAGSRRTCAVTLAGELFCWGANDCGGLGLTPGVDSPVPLRIDAVSDVISVNFYLRLGALTASGELFTWCCSYAPVEDLPILAETIPGAVDTSKSGSVVRLDSGGVLSWGINDFGQVGTGDYVYCPFPETVVSIQTALEVTSDYQADHSCALLASGEVRCWGRNIDGRLGNGLATASPVPVRPVLP